MPRVLRREKQLIDFSNLEYGMLMKFAYITGWRPMGTLEPETWSRRRWPDGEPRPWPKNNYFSSLGQQVTDEDAQAMADSLEEALLDVPNHDAFGPKVGTIIDLPYSRRIRLMRPGVFVNCYEFFSGENKQLLRRFIAFCREGGYSIN